MPEKLTIATSSGLLWLSLVAHFGVGLIALASGAIALVVAKGGRLHKRSGMVFTIAMVALGLSAAGISAYGNGNNIAGGIFTAYLVFTAMTTVRPGGAHSRRIDVAMMLIGFAVATFMLWGATIAWQAPRHVLNGVPALMIYFLGTVALLAAIGDLRVIHSGGITGSRRIARHLWRMCFALFIATGSFFLGQMKFIPASVRSLPVLMILAIGPLFILLYWMWRVRLRKKLNGLVIGRAAGAAG